MSSAVCSSRARSSSGLSWIGGLCSSAADITSAAAPADLPVFVEPVGPCIEIDDLPPNWVVFAFLKNVFTGTDVPTPRPSMIPISASRMPIGSSSPGSGSSSPRPSASAATPWISIAWLYAAG